MDDRELSHRLQNIEDNTNIIISLLQQKQMEKEQKKTKIQTKKEE